MWEVRGSQRVAKQLARLDKAVKEQYNLAFEKLSKNPKAGKILKGYENVKIKLKTLCSRIGIYKHPNKWKSGKEDGKYCWILIKMIDYSYD
jgi:mRNA-degrading endonuclease RelE of RelBE toxin-antitoxin system